MVTEDKPHEKEEKKLKRQIHAQHRARMKNTFKEYKLDSFSEIEKIEFLD